MADAARALVATTNGIYLTTDSGNNWTQKIAGKFTDIDANDTWSFIVVSKNEANTPSTLFFSQDKGSTWISISSDLPEGAVYALEQDHVDSDILFAGTEYGVYVTLDGGKMWRRLKAGLPTINVRDMAIQERENDLVLATFGRGFYVLDNYSGLRDINPELAEKDGYILTVKDVLMFNRWRPLGGLGSREKGFQGEDYFSAPNPEYGVVIKYWVKDGVSSLKAEREKAEKKKRDEGEVVGYPSLEQWKAERDELPSYLIFTITDGQGNFIRELRKNLSKGLNKIKWDMQYPSTYSASAGNASVTAGLPSSGIEVLPGTYSVSMSKNIRGEVIELAGPVSFEIKALNNLSLPASDRAEIVAFKKKAIELNGAVGAVSQAISEMSKKLAPYKAATKAFRGQDAVDLMTEVRALESKVKELQLLLNGDRTPGQLDLDGDVALRQRAGTALYGLFGNFSDVPESARQQYEIASEEFRPLYRKTNALMDEFKAMDVKLGNMGAPLTPGRLPKWK